jgi:hypothetical protein
MLRAYVHNYPPRGFDERKNEKNDKQKTIIKTNNYSQTLTLLKTFKKQ